MECSWNDRGKTKYHIVIFDQLQGHSRGLIWAPESFVRGLLTYDSMCKCQQYYCYLVVHLFLD